MKITRRTAFGGMKFATVLAVLAAAPATHARARDLDRDEVSEADGASYVSLAVLHGCDSAVRGRLSPVEQEHLLAGVSEDAREPVAQRSLLATARFALRVARVVASVSGDTRAASAVARLREVDSTTSAEQAALALDALSEDLSARAESVEGEYVTVLRSAAASYSAAAYLVSLASDPGLVANAEDLETDVAVSVADLLDNALAAGGDRRVVSLQHGTTLLRELSRPTP